MTVVVVDDSAPIRTRLIARLRDAGHEVVGEAGTAAEALALVARVTPDAVVLDVLLPDRRGPEILPALRAIVPRATILILTNAPRYREHCLERGADAFLDKSVDFDDVAETLFRSRR